MVELLNIRRHTIADAYVDAVKKILKEGIDGKKTKYVLHLHIEILKPEIIEIPEILPNKNEQYIQRYVNQVLYGTKNKFKYTYHDRLFKFKGKINQIEYIIEKLCNDSETRQAIAITVDPEIDFTKYHNDGMPCLQEISINIIDDKYFCMTVIFRSNDIYGALFYNMLALIELGKYIKSEIEKRTGKKLIFYRYNHFVINAHIYKTDIPTIEKKLSPKKIKSKIVI